MELCSEQHKYKFCRLCNDGQQCEKSNKPSFRVKSSGHESPSILNANDSVLHTEEIFITAYVKALYT